MQSVAVFLVLVAAASANTIFRVPSHDSAVISSQRVGGNFAYSTHESPAYGVVSPVVSHVTSPVATTYTVQQPASVVSTNLVSAAPATTYTTTGTVQQNVQLQGIPLTQQVAATYGAYPYAYTYGNSIVTPYAVQQSNDLTGVVVEAQKEENKVENVQQVQQQQAVTYAVEQPQVATWAVQQPQVQHVQQVQVQQPQAVTYTTVQQPQVQHVQQVQVQPQQQQAVTYTVQQPNTVQWAVQQPQVQNVQVPVTYSVQQPISVVASGTPASTYKTVAGASPLGFNTWAYGVGQPWGTSVNNVVV